MSFDGLPFGPDDLRDELDLLVTDLLTYLPEAADGEPDDQKGTP